MSESDDQERTEKPSEKRLREAREKGDVPRSRDLSGALVVLAGVAALMSGGERAFVHAKLGAALRDRNLSPHIFDSAEEARGRLGELAARGPDA